MQEIPVTLTAVSRGRLSVMPQTGEVNVEHELTLPAELCPRSKNPISGTLKLRYTSDEVLEVVTLERAFVAVQKEARSLESIGRILADWCSRALSVPVTWEVDALIRPGPQKLRVTGTAA